MAMPVSFLLGEPVDGRRLGLEKSSGAGAEMGKTTDAGRPTPGDDRILELPFGEGRKGSGGADSRFEGAALMKDSGMGEGGSGLSARRLRLRSS